MWSLPNIKSMNDRAVSEHRKRRGRAPGLRGKECEYCNEKARIRLPYHDPFGDAKTREIPKGHLFLCEEHHDRGTWMENYFDCDDCGRLHVLNYTWELYRAQDDDGNTLCLPCAFKRYIADPDHWITEVPKEIGLDELREIPHVVGVETVFWKEDLTFVGNAEFDSMSGRQISGKPIVEIVERALGQAPKCIILLDAGWQFAVSFGCYVPREEKEVAA